MNQEQTQELKNRLAQLSSRERKELIKRAAALRSKAQQGTASNARWSIEQWTLSLLGGSEPVLSHIVISSTSGRCWIEADGEARQVAIHSSVTSVVPGDYVRLEGKIVREVMPRTSLLTRKDPHPNKRGSTLPIVANVDVVVVVVAAMNPPLHPRLIDRYLAAIRKAGAEAIICMNKVDLPDPQELETDREKLRPYKSLGLQVIETSTSEGTGIEELRVALRGRVSCFVGHSGVGKSSLLNSLAPRVLAKTGAVSDDIGKGKHTTTRSVLHKFDGLTIVDTPGIREFTVEFDSPRDVAEAFEEFPIGCRYPNCLHLEEDGCAVKAALLQGTLPRERYTSYRKLLQEAFPRTDHPPSDPDGLPSSSFDCKQCGSSVPTAAAGTQHRNHCPQCLHSLHLDHEPGDRASGCGGVMEPVSVWVRRDGEWAIIHRCRECGELSSNRIAADDNEMLLMSLAVQPLSKPPFPLDRLVEGRLEMR